MICLCCPLVCFFSLLCSNKVVCSLEQNKSSKLTCLYGKSTWVWVQLIVNMHELICGWQAKCWYKLTCSTPIEMQKLLFYSTFNNITPCVLVACRSAATIIRMGNLSNINHISCSSDLYLLPTFLIVSFKKLWGNLGRVTQSTQIAPITKQRVFPY